jgi:selenocysteine lyase/cysteine desulfurase
MGWTNTAEMTASVVDAVNALTRLYVNTHSESPIDPIPLMPRPYEAAREPVKPETITLAAFGDLLKET